LLRTLLIVSSLAAIPQGWAAEAAPQRSAAPCNDCGTVQNIRRLDKPLPSDRAPLSDLASSPAKGGLGNETQAVPLISLSKEGPKRVKPETVRRPTWEITVRYDNGQMGFITSSAQPDLKVGDRVRLEGNNLEPAASPR
jgi:hypothetical protein